MRRLLIVAGIVLLVLGLAWPWLVRLPIGRLPGDILIQRGHFRLYIPVTTMVLGSALLSLVLWLFRK